MARGGRPGVFVFRLESHAALVRRAPSFATASSHRCPPLAAWARAWNRIRLMLAMAWSNSSRSWVRQHGVFVPHVIWLNQQGGAIFDADIIKPRNSVSVGVVIRQLFASGNVPPRV